MAVEDDGKEIVRASGRSGRRIRSHGRVNMPLPRINIIHNRNLPSRSPRSPCPHETGIPLELGLHFDSLFSPGELGGAHVAGLG